MRRWFKQAWEEVGATCYVGDVLDVLADLPSESVHCVVTSPPYWGLRDYGTGTWSGGDSDCKHAVRTDRAVDSSRCSSTLSGSRETVGQGYHGRCGRCGAVRTDAQLGLEPTPEEYVAKMVAVFREVRRVMRKDGTLWLNMGDGYATTPNRKRDSANDDRTFRDKPFSTLARNGLKPKDLVGMPWRLAFALQADGWWLRSDIVWSKPNPMPESVTDRPTRSHEYVFLFTKAARYWYDASAVAESAVSDHRSGNGYVRPERLTHSRGQATSWNDVGGRRNMRSVWTIPTQPYPDVHFACFPEALPTRCVRAGCPPDGVVLDPFAGSGTTLAVAKREGRRAIGIELNRDYLPLIERRVRREQEPLPMDVTTCG